MPEVDPVNVEFVIFARVKPGLVTVVPTLTGKQTPQGWIPLSVVKGGQAANLLVKVRGAGDDKGGCGLVASLLCASSSRESHRVHHHTSAGCQSVAVPQNRGQPVYGDVATAAALQGVTSGLNAALKLPGTADWSITSLL